MQNDAILKQNIEKMNQRELYSSENPDRRDAVRLPVYLRSAGHKKLDNGTREDFPRLHSPFFEMIWCVRGIGEVFLYKEQFLLTEDDIFFYYPNERHVLHSLSQSWELYWFAFDGPNAVAFFDGYGYSRKIHSAEPFPMDLFQNIRRNIGTPSPVSVRLMLAELCRILALAGGTEQTEKEPIRIAMDLIRKNLNNPELNVNFLADQLQIHRTTLVSLFRNRLGCRPGEAIRHKRLNVSKSLLRGTTLPVKEIAARCGIADESSFCRFFRHYGKISPAQYREQEKNKALSSARSSPGK